VVITVIIKINIKTKVSRRPNNLFLNRFEVKVSFVAKRRVAVWVHHYGNVLVDESECKHVAIATLCVVKEGDGIT